MGGIQQKRVSYGVDVATMRHAGAADPEFNFLRYSRPLPWAQMGVRRNWIWLGELRVGSVRSRMGAAAFVEGRYSHEAKRSLPPPDIRRFLVRKGGYRAARARRRR